MVTFETRRERVCDKGRLLGPELLSDSPRDGIEPKRLSYICVNEASLHSNCFNENWLDCIRRMVLEWLPSYMYVKI